MEHQDDQQKRSPASVDPGKVYTHPTAGGGQTGGRGNMANRCFDGRGGATDGGQTDGCTDSVFG